MKYLMSNILMLVLLLLISSCSSFQMFSEQSLSANNAPSEEGSDAKVIDTKVIDSKAAKIALSKALTAIQLNDIAAADHAFKAMVLAGAQSPTALNHYAVFLREQWRMDEAESVYLKALKSFPNNAMTHWNLAIFYELYRGEYKQALFHYQAYQQYAIAPDKRVIHWISDLNRRIEKGAS